MRLSITKSAHTTSYSVIKSAYINGKRTSAVVESLGSEKKIKEKHGCENPESWARQYVRKLNEQAKKKGLRPPSLLTLQKLFLKTSNVDFMGDVKTFIKHLE